MYLKIIATVVTVAHSYIYSTDCFHQKSTPTAVLEAFSKKYIGVLDVYWSKEKNGEWEAEFEFSNAETSATFSADGNWLESETEIRVADLPVPVQAALQSKKVKEAARIECADGSTVFEAEVGKKDWLFNAAGKRLN